VKLTIDNLDGQGARDYSGALCPAASAAGEQAAVQALRIERTLNAPSIASGTLLLNGGPGEGIALPVPARRGRVVISSAAAPGTVLFTGYLATEPVAVYAGVGLAGPVYRYAFSALSDEWLLDKQTATLTGSGLNLPAGALFTQLTTRTAAGVLSTAGVSAGQTVGVFTPGESASWSGSAGAIAGTTCAAYRALNGALSLNPVGAVTHAVNFDDAAGAGTLSPATLRTAQAKELANDVTLTGEIEPAAYVTELFEGDGTTTVFTLASPPFHATRPTLLTDSFSGLAINPQTWQVTDSGSHIGLGAGGLTLAGGNGYDGQTTLAAWDRCELGGSLVFEAADVQLVAPSDGVVLGLYGGGIERDNCTAGFNIRQSGGNTVATPYVSGAEIGTTYTLVQGHRYTIRIRLHTPAVQRAMQTYYARVDGVITAFGGGLVTSATRVTFELVDLGNASNTPATVLYDGAIASSPASCTLALVNSLALTGSIGSVTVTQGGTAWVVSTLPYGALQTRLIGLAGQGVDCSLWTTGKLTFFAGRVPVAGELITVQYRSRSRSVARLEDAASVAAEAVGGLPGTARWLGKVTQPPARSSADCEAAAQAVLALASSRSAAQAGSYACVNPAQDIWPGDVLAITSAGQTINTVVRKVALHDGNAVPEVLTYRVGFANDWAESLGLTLSEAVASDAVLPVTAGSAPNAVIADLPQLAVVSTTSNVLQIDAGTAPPIGGGFEVRLRDFAFGPSGGDDLVLRSAVRSFSIPRTAQVERYYIRMYDGSTPPLYSRHSSAIFTNLPLS
jgi:hypothetical protein